jgi:hypothetical protein
MRSQTDLSKRLSLCIPLICAVAALSAQCPDNQWDMANLGNTYVDELGNKAVFGDFTNVNNSQYVNDGRLYLFGDISNNGHLGDGFGYEYIKTCDSTQTVIAGSGNTEFNILDINNTGGVDLKQKMYIKASLRFSNGIIHTNRLSSTNEVIFLAGASHLASSNQRHINGRVTKAGGEPFVFPLGDSDHLSPLKTRGQNPFDAFTATYYSKNLNLFEWLAPGSFPVENTDYNVMRVQPKEFWTLEGTQSTPVTLYWTTYSDIPALTNQPRDLIVVGWDGEKWVNLGQTELVQAFGTGTITSSNVIPNEYPAYTMGILDTDGDEFPNSEDDDPYDPCTPNPESGACINRYCIYLNTSVWLEGALVAGQIGSYSQEMRSNYNQFGYLPGLRPRTLLGIATDPGQPYNVDPWYYGGNEGSNINDFESGPGGESYPEGTVDWVLVSLRSSTQPETNVCTKAAVVLQDGSVVMTDFFDCCGLDQEAYYVVIQHRNHLPVMSHEPIPITNDTLHYDFRINQSYTALFGFGQKEIEPGKYAMYAGNGDQILAPESPKDINTNDITLWALDNGKHSGYYFQDYDMNGDVNVHDKALWLLNNGVFTDVDR